MISEGQFFSLAKQTSKDSNGVPLGQAAWAFATHNYLRLSCLLQLLLSQYIKMSGNNSSYYSWACSSVVFTWSEVFWVILLKRKCFMIHIKYPIVLAILLYLWLVLRMMRHYTAYGCSNWSNKVGWENLCWHEQCALSIAFVIWWGQTPHWIFEHALLQKKYAFCFPVLLAWDHYFRCWSWPKRLTFMHFYMETAELQAQL